MRTDPGRGDVPSFDGFQDRKPRRTAFPKLVVAAGASLLFALLVAYLAFELISAVHEIGIKVDSNTGRVVLVVIFCFAFAVLFYPLTKRTVGFSKEREVPTPMEQVPAPAVEPVQTEEASELEIPEETADEKLARYKAAQAAIRKAHFLEDGEDFAEMSVQSLLDRKSSSDAEEGTEPNPAAPENSNSPQIESARQSLTRFIGAALTPVVSTPAGMDAYTRFGITLYVAGAAERVGHENQLAPVQTNELIADQIQLLGHKPEIAEGFARNIDEYLTNPKYLRMYDAGRSAMAGQLEDPSTVPAMSEALTNWSQPSGQADEPEQSLVVVMFTDIVGSTALGQAHGDAEAMELLRTHNRIVRDALGKFGGREVKHTGDGIMASFSVVASSVEAAIEIQSAIAHHTASHPEPALQVRIGINAGEPIREGGDFFGTPVQLAARVLDQAGSGEIVVTQVVNELCQGKDFSFDKIGDVTLKGFKEPVPIYRAGT